MPTPRMVAEAAIERAADQSEGGVMTMSLRILRLIGKSLQRLVHVDDVQLLPTLFKPRVKNLISPSIDQHFAD